MHGDRFNVPYKYDSNKGAGYGKTDLQMDKPRASLSTYPYKDALKTEDPDDDEFEIEDPDVLDKFVAKVNNAFVSTDPKMWRSDKAGFVHNQRLALPENAMPQQRTNSISPYPFRSLYKHFNGPPLGGDMNQRNTTHDYFQTGTLKGFASSPPEVDFDINDPVYELDDMPTKDQRAIMRQTTRISKMMSRQKQQ
jgi:hypothetical protein